MSSIIHTRGIRTKYRSKYQIKVAQQSWTRSKILLSLHLRSTKSLLRLVSLCLSPCWLHNPTILPWTYFSVGPTRRSPTAKGRPSPSYLERTKKPPAGDTKTWELLCKRSLVPPHLHRFPVSRLRIHPSPPIPPTVFQANSASHSRFFMSQHGAETVLSEDDHHVFQSVKQQSGQIWPPLHRGVPRGLRSTSQNI